MPPPLITLEEHYYSPPSLTQISHTIPPPLYPLLTDLKVHRVPSMNAGHVSLQIISHAFIPGGPTPSVATASNDSLATSLSGFAEAERKRFKAFATLPMRDPEASSRELERSVKELRMVGALVENHVDGKFYDGVDETGKKGEYDVLWKVAEDLDVPVYLHPSWPSDDMSRVSYGFSEGGEERAGVREAAARSLGTVAWGWHEAVGLHFLRLFFSGVFDRFPKLKVVLGHFGEMIPFMLERADGFAGRFGDTGKRERGLRQVWDENVWVTTAGVWSLAPLKCLLGNTKVERILYSVDYPFETNENGLKWWMELEKSGLLSEEELEMVAYKNAEALLRVQAPKDIDFAS